MPGGTSRYMADTAISFSRKKPLSSICPSWKLYRTLCSSSLIVHSVSQAKSTFTHFKFLDAGAHQPYMLGKVYQPVLMQSSYKRDLLASCKDIKLRASRIKNEARICMQRRMVDMNQTLLDTNENSAQALGILDRLYRHLLSSEIRVTSGAGEYGKFWRLNFCNTDRTRLIPGLTRHQFPRLTSDTHSRSDRSSKVSRRNSWE